MPYAHNSSRDELRLDERTYRRNQLPDVHRLILACRTRTYQAAPSYATANRIVPIVLVPGISTSGSRS
jgi:hypothetical protein